MEDLENKKIVDELKFQKMKDGLFNKRYKMQNAPPPPPPVVQPMIQPMIQQMPFPFPFPFPSNNNNNTGNDNKTSDELFKLFMMKSLFGNDLFHSKKKKVRYKYFYNNVPSYQNHHCMNCPYHSNFNNMNNMNNMNQNRLRYIIKHPHKKKIVLV